MVHQPSAYQLAAVCGLVLSVAACTPAPSKPVGEQVSAEHDPAQVCAHVRELAKLDSEDPAALDQVERDCLETLAAMRTRYQTFTTCVSLASSTAAVLECEKVLTRPRSLLAAAAPTTKLEAVCDHVLGMVLKEIGEAAAQMQPEEFSKLRDKCIADLGTQLELKGVEAFNREAECILAADKLAALEACGL